MTEEEEEVEAVEGTGSRSHGPGWGRFVSRGGGGGGGDSRGCLRHTHLLGTMCGLCRRSNSDYRELANGSIATLAMIETRQAIDKLHKIVKVPGLDAVFIGKEEGGPYGR